MADQVFYGSDGQIIERQKCEIYARVMGYYRPVSHFNPGKKSEFYSRKYFEEGKSLNSKFTETYSEAPATCACETVNFDSSLLGLAC